MWVSAFNQMTRKRPMLFNTYFVSHCKGNSNLQDGREKEAVIKREAREGGKMGHL